MTASVDVLSRFWQVRHAKMAAAGLLHGDDYVIPTCIPTLGNYVTEITPGNIPTGRLCVVGAKTGNNKTRLLWNLAADMVRQGLNVGFASLEVSAEECTPSICSIVTGTARRYLARGMHYDQKIADEVAVELEDRKRTGEWGSLHVTSDIGSVEGVHELISWMASLTEGPNVNVFFVDYFQLLAVSGDGKKFGELNDAVKELVQFIKATGALVIVASQLNRASSHPKHRPDSQSLDSCPLLERYAQFVWLLDHTRSEDEEHKKRTWLIVGKNRHGRGGEIPVEFNYRTHTVREALPSEVVRWPTA